MGVMDSGNAHPTGGDERGSELGPHQIITCTLYMSYVLDIYGTFAIMDQMIRTNVYLTEEQLRDITDPDISS